MATIARDEIGITYLLLELGMEVGFDQIINTVALEIVPKPFRHGVFGIGGWQVGLIWLALLPKRIQEMKDLLDGEGNFVLFGGRWSGFECNN